MISKRLLPKQLLVMLLLLFCGQALRAQDLLVKKSGEVLTVFNIDIADRWVYYTQEASTDSDLKRIAREEVFSVKIAGGEMQTIGAVQPAVPAAPQPAAPVSEAANEQEATGPRQIVRPAAADNAELIAQYNRVHITGVKENIKGNKLAQPSNKPTDNGVAILKISEESVLSNEDVEVQISLVAKQYSLYGYRIFVRNKTNKVLYLDLANTFRIMSNGTAKIYFDDTQITRTTGGSTGGAVNLGAVAGGVGIGGAVGTIASGINVGGAREASVSQTYKNERILKIPPRGRGELPAAYRAKGKEVVEDYDLFVMVFPAMQYSDIALWSIRTYTEADSPWKNHFSICYSTEADFATYSNLEFSLYLGQLIGTKANAMASRFVGLEESALMLQRLVGYDGGALLFSRFYVKGVEEVKDVRYNETNNTLNALFTYF